MNGPRTVFEAIKNLGHDEDFTPSQTTKPTGYWPGSDDKLMLMARRVEQGQPVHDDGDAKVYDELPGEFDSSGASRVGAKS